MPLRTVKIKEKMKNRFNIMQAFNLKKGNYLSYVILWDISFDYFVVWLILLCLSIILLCDFFVVIWLAVDLVND